MRNLRLLQGVQGKSIYDTFNVNEHGLHRHGLHRQL